MYSKEQISLSKADEVVVSDATQNELYLIKKRTKNELELLKKQTERLKLFDANIDIDFVIKLYEIKSSQFSKLAYFYGRKGWFDRLVLHGQVLAGAIVLGFAVHALAFFVVVAAYYKLSEMLSEHYKVEEGNKEAIRQSFNELSEGLRQSIESFNEMERKLDEIFTTLEEQNETLSTKIAQLGLEAGKLHGQVVILEGMVKQLQDQQTKILATTDKISDNGKNLGKEIESFSVMIMKKKESLDLISEKITILAETSSIVEKEACENRQAAHELSRVAIEQVNISAAQSRECSDLSALLSKTKIDFNAVNEEVVSLKEACEKADQAVKAKHSSKERALRLLNRSSIMQKETECPFSSRLV